VFAVGAAAGEPAGADAPGSWLCGAVVAVVPPHAAAITATAATRPRRRFC